VKIALLTVGACLALTACESADARDTSDAAKAVLTCADKAQKAELPQGFPAAFPLPPNTVVIGSERRSEGRVIVTAVSSDPEKDVLSFLQNELPKPATCCPTGRWNRATPKATGAQPGGVAAGPSARFPAVTRTP
jgi:hypothetical protein